MSDFGALSVELGLGFAIVFASLVVLQVLCWAISWVSGVLGKRFPELQGKQEAPIRVPVGAAAALAAEPAVVDDPNFVAVQNSVYIDRPTLLAIIEEAVIEAFPGKSVRILSYGLPRVVEGAGGWTQAGKQTHFGSHRVR